MRPMPKLEVTELPVDELVPYANNAKEHPQKQIDEIAESISTFGNCDPIGVWHNEAGKPEIVEGHGRVLALKKLGITTAPVIYLDHLTDEQRRAYTHVHNQTTMSSGFDYETLVADMDNLNMDWEALGFEEFCFNEEGPSIDESADDLPETIVCRCKRGDVWQLGNHRIMCGDATNSDDVETLMGGVAADMVLSDPPYGMHLDTDFSKITGSKKSIAKYGKSGGNKYSRVIGDGNDFSPNLITTFFDNFSSCKEMFLFGADYYAEFLPNKNDGSWLVWDKWKESQADAIGSEFELIWSMTKHKRRMLRHDWFGFLSSENTYDATHRVHPTQKPVSLLVDILAQWGVKCNSIIDLYGGSGSTLIACEQLNKSCYMMELDEHYCDVIIQRWEEATGNEAVRLD